MDLEKVWQPTVIPIRVISRAFVHNRHDRLYKLFQVKVHKQFTEIMLLVMWTLWDCSQTHKISFHQKNLNLNG